MERTHPTRAAGLLLLLGAFAAILIIGLAGSASASQFADAEQRLVDRINAEELPAASRDYFFDDRGFAHEAAINSLAAAGIAQGCADGRFCPNVPVSRAQMASFLQRGLQLPVTSSTLNLNLFSDLAGSVQSPAINAIADAGITLGCGRYCPGDLVRRAEMASFLARALNL